MKYFSFSLKTLLSCVTAIAIMLVVFQELRNRYYVRKLNHHIEKISHCSVIELLQYCKDQGFREDWTDDTLVAAAIRGDVSAVSALSLGGIDLNRKLNGNRTALMHAAAAGQFNIIKFLLYSDVDAAVCDLNGHNAVEIATDAKQLEIVTLISAYQNPSWENVIQTDRIIQELQSDRVSTAMDTHELLRSEKYGLLAELQEELPLKNQEEQWFRVNEWLRIGIYDNGGFGWMINGTRFNDVW